MSEPSPPEEHQPPRCSLVGGSPDQRDLVRARLAEAGLAIPVETGDGPDDAPIVFLIAEGDADRIRPALADLQRVHPEAAVVVVPVDDGRGDEALALLEAGAADCVPIDQCDSRAIAAAAARARTVALARAGAGRAARRARLLADHVSDGLVLMRPDGTMITDSQLNQSILGLTPDLVVGRSAFDLIHPDDLSATRAAVAAAVATPDGRSSVAFRARTAADQWIWLDAVLVNRCADPEVGALVVAYRDVTARRTAEESAREVERHSREVADSITETLFEMDLEGRLTFVNRSAFDRWGYSEADFQAGLNAFEMIAPDHRGRARANAELVLVGGTPSTAEYLAVRRDGTTFPISIYSTRIVHGGRPAGLRGLIVDITERKRAERALRLAQFTIDRALQMVFYSGLDGRILYANDAGCAALGYARDDLLAKKVWDIDVDPALSIEAAPVHATVFRERGPIARETEFRTRDGRLLPVEITSSLLEFEGTEYIVSVARDVTERRQLESQFLQAQKMEAIGRLAGGIAHDFNNLLTAILGYNDLLLAELDHDDRRRREVLEVRKAVDRAASLTRQLLAFSRKQVIQPRPLDLNTVVVGFERMLRRLIGEDIRLVIVPSNGLGLVLADPGQIEQVIMNLAVNARDAMPSGGTLLIETANVTLDDGYARQHTGVTAGEYVQLAVSDTGTGMDDETKARLFEPFFSTKERGKGTGLGLATVYGIVQQSGGHIWVYSEPNHGATFKCYFPRIARPAHADHPRSEEDGPAQRGSETIMVVEDEMAVRQLVRDILSGAGYSVIEAGDPREALSFLDHHPGPLHLLVTDIVMPGMSGKELAAHVIAHRRETAVLFMSGYTDQVIVQSGVLGSDVAFLQKPFTPDGLTRRVRELLDALPPGPDLAV